MERTESHNSSENPVLKRRDMNIQNFGNRKLQDFILKNLPKKYQLNEKVRTSPKRRPTTPT